MNLKLYKIQFTRAITSEPEYEYIYSENRTLAQTNFWHRNPTFFITSTIEIDKL